MIAVAIAIIFYTLYSSNLLPGQGVVESALEGLGYRPCGSYTVRPGGKTVTFSKEFSGEFRCYVLIKRPGPFYIMSNPEATLLIEPPSEKTVYRYSFELNTFGFMQRLSLDELLKPYSEWGVGLFNRTRIVPPPTVFNDDFYVVFSYKAEADNGYPVRVTLTVRTNVEQTPVAGPVVERPTRLAEKLGIKDIKAYMYYLGYELCGEFHAKDVKEVQEADFSIEIDLNEGRACYILIHPPPGGKALLISYFRHNTTYVGDIEQRLRLLAKFPNGYVVGTPFTLRSAFEALGLGRVFSSAGDVPKPFETPMGSALMVGEERMQMKFFDNTPALIYFAYKAIPEATSEPLRFRLVQHVHVEFTIIPADFIVEVK
jgi:hypothetical protein